MEVLSGKFLSFLKNRPAISSHFFYLWQKQPFNYQMCFIRGSRTNRRRSLFKNDRNCPLRTSTKGHLVLSTFNSYSFNFKGGFILPRTCYCLYRAPCQEGEQFLWFLKSDLFPLFIDSSKRNFLLIDVLGKEYFSYSMPNYDSF